MYLGARIASVFVFHLVIHLCGTSKIIVYLYRYILIMQRQVYIAIETYIQPVTERGSIFMNLPRCQLDCKVEI